MCRAFYAVYCLGGIAIKKEGVLCSSAGASSPFKRRKEGHNVDSVQPLRTAVVVAPPPGPPGCRPWDRGDLLQRLATYKSISWFGKPHVRTSHKICMYKTSYMYNGRLQVSVYCSVNLSVAQCSKEISCISDIWYNSFIKAQ